MTCLRLIALIVVITGMIVMPAIAESTNPHYIYVANRSFELANEIDNSWNNINDVYYKVGTAEWQDITELGIYYELKKQTILMEKQNELLAEQNDLIRNLSHVDSISGTQLNPPSYHGDPLYCNSTENETSIILNCYNGQTGEYKFTRTFPVGGV